jgi:hypothetical protein
MVHDRAGEVDTARVLYEQAVNPVIAGLWYEAAWYPVVLRRLGELYEARGDREKAVAYYGEFVDLWKGADRELQPQVAAVRRQIAILLPESGHAP